MFVIKKSYTTILNKQNQIKIKKAAKRTNLLSEKGCKTNSMGDETGATFQEKTSWIHVRETDREQPQHY